MEGQWQCKRVLGLSIFSDCPCAFKLKNKKKQHMYIYIYILCVIGYVGRSLKQTFFILVSLGESFGHLGVIWDQF